MDDKKFRGFDDDIIDEDDFEEDTEPEADDNEEEVSDDEVEKPTEEEETSDVKDDDSEAEGEKDSEEDKKSEEAERNARFAEKRRAKEAKEREEKEAKIRAAAKLEAELGIIKENPYTNKPIRDEQDLSIYKLMKEIDENGGDPISDLPDKFAELKRKENAEKKALEEEASREAKKKSDEASELHNAYPDLDLNKLARDDDFLDLCASKGGRWTMLECYEYLKSKRETAEAKKVDTEEDVSVKENGKKVSKVPSSANSGAKISNDNYMDMTDEEYLRLQKEKSKDFF